MSDLASAISQVSTGIANIVLESNGERLGSGSGFLIDGGLVTADHVVSHAGFDIAVIRFDDDLSGDIRLDKVTLQQLVSYRSPENDIDLAIVNLDEPELADRHRFELNDSVPPVGTQVIVAGYPYDTPHQSSHVGYISASYTSGPAQVLQLDASVNPSNSGGPVIEPDSLSVVGYVTRAQTGLTADFDQLIQAFRDNVEALQGQQASISIGGVDPVQGLSVTMASMERLAVNMKRSANVGIGYAFSALHILENT